MGSSVVVNLWNSVTSKWDQRWRATNGNANVRPIYGTGETTKNRNINAAATTYAESTNSCAWTSTDNVKEFWVTATAPKRTDTAVDVNTGILANVDAAVAAATGLVLMGYSVRESAAAAAVATVQIVHGATAAGGTAVVEVELAANESKTQWFGRDGIPVASGISLNVTAGTVDVDLYYATVVTVDPLQDFVRMLLDPPSAAYCTSAFSDTGGRSVNVDYFQLPYGVRCGPFTGTDYFSSIAFLPSVASTRIIVEAQ